ncbi:MULTISPECIES: helix-turn-helix domain-containing protein [Lysobacter]|uniref:helix-turn-helix domain-containing protein n=1 Tax=Lysobacter TaxID=68 RepID=UPI001CBBAC15|nr:MULTISPECIES: helix-turn-helix domain-containing protein [Lysobacter]UJB19245.1 helix-turn-helix domain-containing protein [Lysobacter capsici]UJQ27030.1 helix-turn-helix domain-containing protein [Lysobacter gummosus]
MSGTYLSPEELAARWDVKIETLQRWRCEGVGPRFLKMERRIRYRLEDIASYESDSLRSSVASAQAVCA